MGLKEYQRIRIDEKWARLGPSKAHIVGLHLVLLIIEHFHPTNKGHHLTFSELASELKWIYLLLVLSIAAIRIHVF